MDNQRNECESSQRRLIYELFGPPVRENHKVAICNPLKKLLTAPRELRNLISQQMGDLPTHIFLTVDFRMAEEDTDKENQETGETNW